MFIAAAQDKGFTCLKFIYKIIKNSVRFSFQINFISKYLFETEIMQYLEEKYKRSKRK